jgi:hypothetical protein
MGPGTIEDGLVGPPSPAGRQGRKLFFPGREDGKRHDTYYNPCRFSLSISIIVSIRMVVVPAFPALILDATGERMTNQPLFSLTHLADDISVPTSISKPYATAQPMRNAPIDRNGYLGPAVII